MKKRALVTAFFLCILAPLSVFAHGKHVHGEAEMEVAVDGNELFIGISGPLASFLGFEHAPRDEKEKKALSDMRHRLDGEKPLFDINPEAKCAFSSGHVLFKTGDRTISPMMLPSAEVTEKEGHVDMDASWLFSCKNPDALKSIRVQLFRYFSGLTELDVSLVTPKKQLKTELTTEKPLLSW